MVKVLLVRRPFGPKAQYIRKERVRDWVRVTVRDKAIFRVRVSTTVLFNVV